MEMGEGDGGRPVLKSGRWENYEEELGRRERVSGRDDWKICDEDADVTGSRRRRPKGTSEFRCRRIVCHVEDQGWDDGM